MARPAAVLDILVVAHSGKAATEIRKFDKTLKQTSGSATGIDRELSRASKSMDQYGASAQKASRATQTTNQALDQGGRSATAFGHSMSRSSDATNKWAESFGGLKRGIELIRWEGYMAAAAAAAQATGALGASVVGLTSALAPLSGALVAVPAVMGGLVQSVGTGIAAFSGISDVLKALGAEQTATGASASSMGSAITSSANQVRSAEQSLVDSHKAVADAQMALTDAREQARQELVDLRLAETGANLSQKEALLQLQRARRTLRETEADPKAGRFEERDAILAVQEAELGLQNARVESRRAEDDRREAERKGVEQSDQVVAAKDQLAQAQRGVVDATRALTEAQKAQTEAMKGTSTEADNLAVAMGKLSPAAQEFARFLFDLKPRLDELRETAAKGLLPGAQEGLESAMKNFDSLNTILRVTGNSMGDFAAKAGKFLGRAGFGKDLETIGRGNVELMEHLGDAVLNLTDAFRHVLVAAQPFLDWLGKGIESFSSWIEKEAEAGRETGKLADFFDRTQKVMSQLGSILADLGDVFLDVGHAARPLGEDILKTLVQQARHLSEWTSSNGRTLATYFEEAHDPLWEAGRLFNDIVKAFFSLSQTEGLTDLIHMVRMELLPALTNVVEHTTEAFGPTLIAFLTEAARLFEDIGGSTGPLVMLVEGAGNFLRTINDLIDAVPVLGTLLASALSLKAILGFLPGKGLSNSATARFLGIGTAAGAATATGYQQAVSKSQISMLPTSFADKAKGGMQAVGRNLGGVLAGGLIFGFSASISAQGGLMNTMIGAVGGGIAGFEIGSAFGGIGGPVGAAIGAIASVMVGSLFATMKDKAAEESKDTMTRIGALAATSFSEGFVDNFDFGDVAKGAAAGQLAIPIPGLGALLGGAVGLFDSIKGGLDSFFGGTEASNNMGDLQDKLEGIQNEQQGISKNYAHQLLQMDEMNALTGFQRKQVEHWIQDVARLRTTMEKDIGINIRGLDPAEAKKFSNEFVHNLALLKGDTLRTLGGVADVTDQQMKLIQESLGKHSKQGRIAMAEQYSLAIARLKKMLDDADPATKKRIKALVDTYTHELNLIQPTRHEAQETGKELAKGIQEGFAKTGAVSKQGINDIVKELDKLPDKSRGIAFKMFRQQLDDWAGSNAKKKKLVDQLNDDVINSTRDFATKGKNAEQQLHQDTAKIFGDLHNVASQGLTALETDLNKALKGMGLDPVHFGLGGGKGGKAGAPNTPSPGVSDFNQRGGIIHRARGGLSEVRGTGTGDKVHAMLEPGEVVVNRKAVAKMGGPDHVDKINQIIPRFQGGGVVQRLAQGGKAEKDKVKVPEGGFPDAMGALPGLDAVAYIASQKFPPVHVTSGAPPTHDFLTASGNPSDHGWGGAVDLSDGGIMTPTMTALARFLSTTIGGAGSPWSGSSTSSFAGGGIKQMIYGTPGGSAFGDHTDHVHVALLPDWANDAARVAAALGGAAVSGAIGAAVQQLQKVTLEGPAGPLTDIGQKALDKTLKGANEYLEKHAPEPTVGGAGAGSAIIPEGGGSVVTQMGRILAANAFSQAGAAGIIGNAYGESTWNPASIGTGGGGLFGFTSGAVSLAALQSYAQRKGQPWTDVGLQMEFMLSGSGSGGLLTGAYSDLESFLKTTSDVHAATFRFMDEWERPGVPRFSVRLGGANQAMGMISGLFGGAGKNKGQTMAEGGVVAGGDSLMQGMWDNAGFPSGWDVWHVGGAQSDEIAAGIRDKIEGGEKAVAFEGGPNDGGNVSAVKAAIKSIKQKTDAPLVVQTLASGWDNASGINQMLQHVGAAQIADWGSEAGSLPLHPGPEGYRQMQGILHAAVKKASAKGGKGGKGGGGGGGGDGGPGLEVGDAEALPPSGPIMSLGEWWENLNSIGNWWEQQQSGGAGGGGGAIAGNLGALGAWYSHPKKLKLDLKKLFHKVGTTGDADAMKKLVEKAKAALQGVLGPGFSPAGDEYAGDLKKLWDNAATFEEWAGRADEGDVGGHNQRFWWGFELNYLFALRNRLIQAHEFLTKQKTKVDKASGDVGGYETIATDQLQKVNDKLNVKGKTPKDWKGAQDPVIADVKKWNDLEPKKRRELMHKFLNQGGELPGRRQFLHDGTLVTDETRPSLFPDPKPWERRLQVFGKEGKIAKALTSAGTYVGAALDFISPDTGELFTLQGRPTENAMTVLDKIPPIRVMGGMIGILQENLAQAVEAPDNRDELIELLREELNEAQLRNLVEQAQTAAILGLPPDLIRTGMTGMVPVMGAMAKGGPIVRSGAYLVGEEGPEIVGLQQGAQVVSNQDIPQLLEPKVDVGVYMHPSGDKATVVVNGQSFERQVERATRGVGKRPLPSARGY